MINFIKKCPACSRNSSFLLASYSSNARISWAHYHHSHCFLSFCLKFNVLHCTIVYCQHVRSRKDEKKLVRFCEALRNVVILVLRNICFDFNENYEHWKSSAIWKTNVVKIKNWNNHYGCSSGCSNNSNSCLKWKKCRN